MGQELKTIKVTEKTVQNLNIAAGYAKKRQWEIAEQASKDILQKIFKKIKEKK